MGSVLDKDNVGDTVNIRADISDPDAKDVIGKVEVIVNGGLSVAQKNITTNKATVEFNVPANYSYYYLKVTEGDKDIAVTSPVWVGKVEACGINKTYTKTDLPVAGEDVDVNIDFYNNETKELQVNSIEASVDGQTVKTVTAAELEKAGVSKIASNGTGTYSFDYRTDSVGIVKLDITARCTLDGVDKVYRDVVSLKMAESSLVANVIVD
jgi:hypothetical protein